MSLPLKIAIGTVGSGAIAVGGHEIFAASTGKAGLFISKASTNNQERTGGQAVVSGESSGQTSEGKIRQLLTGWNGKCVLKIRAAENDQNQELDYSQHTNSLDKLFEKLNEFSKNNCKDSTDSVKTIIFKETNGEWSEITDDVANKINEALLKYFQIDEDIVFTVRTKNESRWTDLSDSYLAFKSNENDSKTIEAGFLLSNENQFTGDNAYNGTMKRIKNNLPKEFENWKCIITFNKTEAIANTLENSEKLIKSTDTKGFFDKLKTDTHGASASSDDEKIRELKKRFIASCGTGKREFQDDGATLINSKTFELQENTEKTKLVFSDQPGFKSWFEEIELTEEENNWASGDEDWTISSIKEQPEKTLELKKEGIASCFIQLRDNSEENFETKLKEKINKKDDSNKTENRKKLLRKCRNKLNNWFIYVESKKANDTITKIFSS